MSAAMVISGVSCYEENGTAYHKVDSPFELWQRSEHRADRWFYEKYVSVAQIEEAFKAGYTETWQLAEWFELPESRIKKALHYWTACRGVDFNLL